MAHAPDADEEWNHQGLNNRLIRSTSVIESPMGAVQCQQRLGGIFNFCFREAA